VRSRGRSRRAPNSPSRPQSSRSRMRTSWCDVCVRQQVTQTSNSGRPPRGAPDPPVSINMSAGHEKEIRAPDGVPHAEVALTPSMSRGSAARPPTSSAAARTTSTGGPAPSRGSGSRRVLLAARGPAKVKGRGRLFGGPVGRGQVAEGCRSPPVRSVRPPAGPTGASAAVLDMRRRRRRLASVRSRRWVVGVGASR